MTARANRVTEIRSGLGSDVMSEVKRLPILGADEPEETLVRVGELAKSTGKSVRALHLYEELGLLEPSSRSGGGYRLYGVKSAERVKWIATLQELGCTLPEIRALVVMQKESANAKGAKDQLEQVYQRKLIETRAQIGKLKALEDELSKSLEYLATCHSCEPERPVSACGACERHECDGHAPALVHGLQS